VRKKRVLLLNESSFLSTGFATYGLEVLKRLHATGKYELCELGVYANPFDRWDERAFGLPWKFIHATPPPGDQRAWDEYNSQPTHQFGGWKFEAACLEFKPDIVFTVRDAWMDEAVQRSPFRPYYHWAHMATVDAAPQDEQWVAMFADADAVFTYSDWALGVLREQGRGHINLKTSASPGADLDTLRPVPDRRAHRDGMGVDPDCFIVGTVMRNQRRKLYPDLLVAFAEFLQRAPRISPGRPTSTCTRPGRTWGGTSPA
jgi:glycosyltransferase involved in cell wall biosynthesis